MGVEAETESLEAESGLEASVKSLGAKLKSRWAPEAKAQPSDFVVATEQELEEVLATYYDLDYLASC